MSVLSSHLRSSIEEHKLSPKVGGDMSTATRKTALSFRLLRELLPSRPFKPPVDDSDLFEKGNDEHKDVLSLRKLHDDLDYIEKVFLDVAVELSEKNTFTCIEKFLATEKDDQQKKADFIALFHGEKWKAKYFEKSNKLRSLQRELRTVKQDTQNLMQSKDEDIADLRKDIAEGKSINPKREEFEKKMAKAQVESLQFRIEQEEESICKKIAKVGREIPQEIRVHDALTAFLKECCAKLEAKILQWEEKFKEDTDMKKEEVGVWQGEVQSKKRELEDLEGRYEEYWSVVRVYEAVQEEERLKKEEELRIHNAAAKIQAWWRGYVVRKEMSSGLRKKKKSKK